MLPLRIEELIELVSCLFSSSLRISSINYLPLRSNCILCLCERSVTALKKGAARRRHSLDIRTEGSLTKETLDQKLLYLRGFSTKERKRESRWEYVQYK